MFRCDVFLMGVIGSETDFVVQIPRSAKWVKHRVEGLGDKVTGVFDRETRQAGIETEV